MSIPRDEQETTITYLRSDTHAYISTSNPSLALRWQKLGYTTEVAGHIGGKPSWWKARVPVGCISYRKVAAATKRLLTPERHAALLSSLSTANRTKRERREAAIADPPELA